MTVLADEQACLQRERHAVLYLSLKICKSGTWAANQQGVRYELQKAWLALGIPASAVPAWFAPQCRDIVMRTLRDDELPGVLGAMTRALQEIHGRPVWVLIDEYDAPIQTAWQHGFYREAVDFLRPFLGEALKDSSCVVRAVMTGILPGRQGGHFLRIERRRRGHGAQ